MPPPLRPVLLSVDPGIRRGRHLVDFLSDRAREAARRSATRSGLVLTEFLKNEDGAPLPCGGVFWSLTHKDRMVGGLADLSPAGLDVECVTPRDEALFDYIGTAAEWAALGGRDWGRFFRLFTAKEAALKRRGVGLAGLRTCRAEGWCGSRLVLGYMGERTEVEFFEAAGHLAAVAATGRQVEWEIGDI